MGRRNINTWGREEQKVAFVKIKMKKEGGKRGRKHNL